jgi:hypothetical protein
MSPEQARGNPDEIDYRSDIYALGVLLYEMLTGRLPYDLKQRPLMEALRIVSEETPRRPATLQRALAGDLDTILLKALEKQPARRYQSVAALSDDLQRHLDDLPIEARPATLAYQVQKLARRHRGQLLGWASPCGGARRAPLSACQLAGRHAGAAGGANAEQVSRFLRRSSACRTERGARQLDHRARAGRRAARIDTSPPTSRSSARAMAVMGDVPTMGLYSSPACC